MPILHSGHYAKNSIIECRWVGETKKPAGKNVKKDASKENEHVPKSRYIFISRFYFSADIAFAPINNYPNNGFNLRKA